MRKLRINSGSVWHHVIARTNNKALLIESAQAKELFLQIVAKAKHKFQFDILNYVIMDNHFHLLLRPAPDESLSVIMKWIMGVYAMSWNRVFQSCGHFWGDRYYARPIENFSDLASIAVYIDQNPVRACLVNSADQWYFSGISAHRRGDCRICLAPTSWVLQVSPRHAQLCLPPVGSDPEKPGSPHSPFTE